jgi:hypothetical protein
MLACHINAVKSKNKGYCEPTALVGEVWMQVPNYPRYEVSSLGELRRNGYTDHLGRTYKTRYIKGRTSSRIGCRVILCGKECKDFILARVIATTFYGYPLDTELTVNHIDGNRDNNNIGNLELVTRQENSQHAHDHGLCDSKYITTRLKDTHTGKVLAFKSQIDASTFLGKNKSFIANAKRDNRLDYGKYRLVV